MKLIIKSIFVFTLAMMVACTGPKAISTIESDSYDNNAKQTIFNKFPLGTISLPGKWIKVSYNPVSFQHGFKSVESDSIYSSVAINQASSYPLYKPKMSSNEVVNSLYEWDSKYLADNMKGTRTIIKQDTVNHFVIWQLTAKNEKYTIDNHYLFGSENGIIFTVLIITNKWTNEQKVDYLQNVYMGKTVGTCCK